MAYYYIFNAIKDSQGLRPDIPQNVSWVGQPDLETNTYLVKTVDIIDGATQVIPVDEYYHPSWEAGKSYEVADVVEYEGYAYRVIQAHTSQAGWEPPMVPALFVRYTPPGMIVDWIQPLGEHDAYEVGAMVLFDGQVWESVINNNVWKPGVYGWELAKTLSSEAQARGLIKNEIQGTWAIGGEV